MVDEAVHDSDTCQAADAVAPDGLHGADGNLILPYPAAPPPPPRPGGDR
jgi:hypothetical protein